MIKISRPRCQNLPVYGWAITPTIESFAPPLAISALATTASQVINSSFGTFWIEGYCEGAPASTNDPYCIAIRFARHNDVVLVGASGNNFEPLQFPTSVAGFHAVGGVFSNRAIWDDRIDPLQNPSTWSGCPAPFGTPTNRDCGSNYTIFPSERQETVALAKSVKSLFYPGETWNFDPGCSDALGGGASNDGVGLCTGTSMSSPIVAGIAGLLRSINPLVAVGDPLVTVGPGIRNVLTSSTDRAAQGLGWDPKLGYGIVDADAAAQKMLGTVAGSTVANRLTPLFTLWSEGAQDSIAVASPQLAIALARYSNASATSRVDDGALTPSFATFPSEPEFSPPQPRAALYVLTTEQSPSYPGRLFPTPIPLFVAERTRPFPVGCTSGAGCNVENRDYVLLISTDEVENARAMGYNHRGRQGYIFPNCTPEPACIPAGSVRVLRRCNMANDDCAVFPEAQASLWLARGYAGAMFPGGNDVLGYAYPNIDSDGDGLIDGMEHVVGTNPFAADSNSDGITDGAQFPQTGISLSDPCGGASSCLRSSQTVFASGFEL